LNEALGFYDEQLPPDHRYVGAALLALGRALIESERPAEAQAKLTRALQIANRAYSSDSPAMAAINAALGGALLGQHRLTDAEPLLRDAYPILLTVRGPEDFYSNQVRDWITALYAGMGQTQKAAVYFDSLAAKVPLPP